MLSKSSRGQLALFIFRSFSMFDVEGKRGRQKTGQDSSWSDGGNGICDVILQGCTDVRHFSRFLEEKEGFKWKWILNDGVIAGRSCTSHSSLTAGTGHHIAYYQWRACCWHSKIIRPYQKLGSGRCAVNFKSHFTNKGSSKTRSKWMITTEILVFAWLLYISNICDLK